MHSVFERVVMDHPKPHIQRITNSHLVGRHGERCHWACALVMLNPFFGVAEVSDQRRFFYVQPPMGAGTTPIEAYDDWHRLQTCL